MKKNENCTTNMERKELKEEDMLLQKTSLPNSLVEEEAHFHFLEVLYSRVRLILLGGGPRQPRRGDDLVHEIPVTLEELYKGKSSKMAVTRNVVCGKCEG